MQYRIKDSTTGNYMGAADVMSFNRPADPLVPVANQPPSRVLLGSVPSPVTTFASAIDITFRNAKTPESTGPITDRDPVSLIGGRRADGSELGTLSDHPINAYGGELMFKQSGIIAATFNFTRVAK